MVFYLCASLPETSANSAAGVIDSRGARASISATTAGVAFIISAARCAFAAAITAGAAPLHAAPPHRSISDVGGDGTSIAPAGTGGHSSLTVIVGGSYSMYLDSSPV